MAAFDFPAFPRLTTERLILREVTAADAADILVFRGDPEVQKYDDDTELASVAEARALVEEIAAWYAKRQALTWGVTLRGGDRVVGLFALYFWDRRYDVGSLGYDLARAYWRQGIATEACRAILKFGFETMGLHRINVDTRMDNVASVRLMARVGFRHEGARRECIRSADGTWQTWGIFGMLEDEYRRMAGPA